MVFLFLFLCGLGFAWFGLFRVWVVFGGLVWFIVGLVLVWGLVWRFGPNGLCLKGSWGSNSQLPPTQAT